MKRLKAIKRFDSELLGNDVIIKESIIFIKTKIINTIVKKHGEMK